MRLIDADTVKDKMRMADWNRLEMDKIPEIRPAASEWKPLSEEMPEKVEGKQYLLRQKLPNGKAWFEWLTWNGRLWNCSNESLHLWEIKCTFTHYAEIMEVQEDVDD